MDLRTCFLLLPCILTTSLAIPQKRTNRAQSPAASVESIYNDAGIFTIHSSLPTQPAAASLPAKQLTQQTGKQRESLGDDDQTSGEDDGRPFGGGGNFNEFDSLGLQQQQQQQQHQGGPPFYFQGGQPGYYGGGGGPYYSPGRPHYFAGGPYFGGDGGRPPFQGQGGQPGQPGQPGQFPGGQIPQTQFGNGFLPNGQLPPQFGGIQPGVGGIGNPTFGGFGLNQFGGAQFPILSTAGGAGGNVALDEFGVDKVQAGVVGDGKKKTEVIKTTKSTSKSTPPQQVQKNLNNSAPQSQNPSIGPQQQQPRFFFNGFPQFGFPPQFTNPQFGPFGQNFVPPQSLGGIPGSGSGTGQQQQGSGNQESAVVQIEGGQFDPNGSGQVSGGSPFGQPFSPGQGFLSQGIPGGVTTSRPPPSGQPFNPQQVGQRGGQYPGFSIDYNPFAFYAGRPAFGFDPRLAGGGQFGTGQFGQFGNGQDGSNAFLGNDVGANAPAQSGRGGLISAQIPQSSSSISRSTVVKRHEHEVAGA